MRIARRLAIPFSIKARGADIHHWARQRATGPQITRAANAASGLLAVSAAMREDMIALGIEGDKIRVHYTGVDFDRFRPAPDRTVAKAARSEEHTSELQSLMRISYAVFCLKKKKYHQTFMNTILNLIESTSKVQYR